MLSLTLSHTYTHIFIYQQSNILFSIICTVFEVIKKKKKIQMCVNEVYGIKS